MKPEYSIPFYGNLIMATLQTSLVTKVLFLAISLIYLGLQAYEAYKIYHANK